MKKTKSTRRIKNLSDETVFTLIIIAVLLLLLFILSFVRDKSYETGWDVGYNYGWIELVGEPELYIELMQEDIDYYEGKVFWDKYFYKGVADGSIELIGDLLKQIDDMGGL